ncbi:MAG: uridine diphosphate-N-acetylglucosamine-binding protein YvcK [Actinobacteria bacterium]|nr:uridine diphosphate-N-acetylglucosamine-binding protein YvcK [Actinomycetota bacterium]
MSVPPVGARGSSAPVAAASASTGVDPLRGPDTADPAVVALGGGHGLSTSLRALRRLTSDVTAVVGVADDGGSSGRIRSELALPPPGDLRMALAALCGDDAWGQMWSKVMQHRFGGDGELTGHATGNLLIASLWEETGSLVEGLDWVAALLGAHGRVLPVAIEPLNIVADVQGIDPERPSEVREITGQVELEHSTGIVLSLRVEPAEPKACPEAVAAIQVADAIVLGPGSWYTSVLPHLLVPGVRRALAELTSPKILVLNLDGQAIPAEDELSHSTQDFRSAAYLRDWHSHFPDVPLDFVLADPACVDDLADVQRACDDVGAELVLAEVADIEASDAGLSPRHDPDLLEGALGTLLSRGNI